MSVPYIFSPNTTIRSAEINANFAAVDSDFDGGEISGGIFPDITNTLDLGTSLRAFRAIYTHSLRLADTDGSHFLSLVEGSNLTANRTLTFITGDSDRTLTLTGNASIGGVAYTVGGTDVALADGGLGTSLVDPNADRILFWDDSAGVVDWLIPGTGIIITDKTISTSGAGLSIAGTDNHLIRMDGTSNIQDSAVIVNDSGDMQVPGSLLYEATNVMTSINKSVSTSYQAVTDGFVLAICDGSGGAGTGYAEVLSDSSNPPTTFMARADVISGGKDSRLVPVRAGDFYKVNTNTDSGAIVFTVTFVGLGTSAA